MNKILGLAFASSVLGLSACSTTDAVSLPFDLASTTGDTATSSSSTSGGDDSQQANLDQQRFVSTQIEWIRRDAARGEGESLAALAQLLGETDSEEFARWSQANYSVLFAQLDSPSQLLERIAVLRH